ncbi:hypothetical protein DB30_04892 [Enhygromyxa salina]|uniref:Uncharacterized protein n=2 Tax=Enhygromyxa salina TaxID=215803 RepID=A0A0C1ZEU0_9BACT|nr:hypothetical protein DB30_04892 [Enhygromyxa salina]
MKQLWDHYSGNCVSCERCNFYVRIERGEPGAAEEYAAYMRAEHGKHIKLIPG